MTKKERSLALKKALENLLRSVRDFYARGDEVTAVALREGTAKFYDRQLRHLMYRDWSAFEQFFVEILKCNSLWPRSSRSRTATRPSSRPFCARSRSARFSRSQAA